MTRVNWSAHAGTDLDTICAWWQKWLLGTRDKLGYHYTHRINVRYIYLHLADVYGFHVGKSISPMDPMG